MKNFTREQIETAISNAKSIAEASRNLNINYKTLRSYAIKYELFKPNQEGKGIHKSLKHLGEIIKTFNVKRKLFRLGLKEKKCECCGITDSWMGKPISLELHHVDGNNRNNDLSNLQILCPNCHSQTPNYRNRKRVAQEVIPEVEDIKFREGLTANPEPSCSNTEGAET